jgi:predicted nucleic acid-binding protein
MIIFDASALLNIIRSLGSDSFNYLKGNYILTLTPYEIGNALWRESTLLKRISNEEAFKILNLISSSYKILNMVSPKDMLLVLKLAQALRVTYYDSSYLVASKELNADLVTDDENLSKRVLEKEELVISMLGRKVRIFSTKELIHTSKK